MEKTVFVNEEKRERAQYVYDLLVGKAVARNAEERERADHYARIAQAEGLDLKKDPPAAVAAIYVKMGGLLRTEAEQKVAEARKEEAKVKGKKDKMGLR